MLFVPYSSTIETMRLRRPVRIEATAITTVTPMTMPSTVRKLRSLFARTMLNAIAMVSVGMIDRNIIYFAAGTAQGALAIWRRRRKSAARGYQVSNAPCTVPFSALVQRHDRVQPRSLVRRIDACDQPDPARHSQRQQDIADCDRHRDRR